MLRLRAFPLIALLTLGLAQPAMALQFGKSSTTNESVFFVPARTWGQLYGPIDYRLGLRFTTGLSAALGPAPVPAGSTEASSVMLDGDLALAYRWTLVDVDFLGRFNPAIVPFLGYRGLMAPTVSGTVLPPSSTTTLPYLHGLYYGVGADTEIPLGFRAYAHGGLTTLLGGGYQTYRNGLSWAGSGSISPGGATLPMIGAGISWSAGPFFGLGLGYDGFALPTDMRATTATLGPGRTWINALTVSIRLLGLSF